jgi:hypothetical protein
MAAGSMKVPAIITCGVICLGIGLAVGAVGGMYYEEYQRKQASVAEQPTDPDKAKEMMAKMNPGGGMPGGGMPGGGPPGGGMPGKGPSDKDRLANLVTKLDLLTDKTITLKLTEQQKARVAEQLKGLADKNELTDEEAKKRLDALKEILKDDSEALAAVGFRWPGEKGGEGKKGGAQPPPPNPLAEPEARARLEALQQRLGKK